MIPDCRDDEEVAKGDNETNQSERHQRTNHLRRIVVDDDGGYEDDDGYEEEDQYEDEGLK